MVMLFITFHANSQMGCNNGESVWHSWLVSPLHEDTEVGKPVSEPASDLGFSLLKDFPEIFFFLKEFLLRARAIP